MQTVTPAAGVQGLVVPGRESRTGGRPLRAAMIAAWPLEVEPGFDSSHSPDPWVTIVRESISDYRSGRADRASQRWHEDIRWRIPGDGGLRGEWTGAEQIFNLHRLVRRLTDNTFRQHLVALEGSGSPFVDAHVRTTAARLGRTLDTTSLIVFELASGRISCVTEMPGDREAWRAFWAD